MMLPFDERNCVHSKVTMLILLIVCCGFVLKLQRGIASAPSLTPLLQANSCEHISRIGEPLPKREARYFSPNRQGILRAR